MILLVWTWLALGCGSSELEWVPRSTLRVSQPNVEEGTELELKIMVNDADCRNGGVSEDELHLCRPYVDRASGEVRIPFQFKLDSLPFPLPLTEEHVEVSHEGQKVLDGDSGMEVTVIPHGPNRSKQLFILVIDGSGSMNEVDARGRSRIDKVRRALLLPQVVDRFFPEEIKTGVVLLTFTDGDPRPVGTNGVEIITNPKRYKKLVKNHLTAPGGYTHMYNAVRYSSGELLALKQISDWLDFEQAQPTIVTLTDGYNNLSASDTCGDNAKRLTTLLKRIREARYGDDVDIRTRPSFFTIGLGKPFRSTRSVLAKLNERNPEVKPRQLCGKYYDYRIDGNLERYGIDNASLQWIAKHGGGLAYTRQDSKGLAEAFEAAAATRYDWFELRYRIDQAYLRRSFESRIRLVSFAEADSNVRLHPSAWMDPPSGLPGEDGWHDPPPFRTVAAAVMPLLGLLVGLTFMGAALFNTRRVVFGRVKAGTRRK